MATYVLLAIALYHACCLNHLALASTVMGRGILPKTPLSACNGLLERQQQRSAGSVQPSGEQSTAAPVESCYSTPMASAQVVATTTTWACSAMAVCSSHLQLRQVSAPAHAIILHGFDEVLSAPIHRGFMCLQVSHGLPWFASNTHERTVCWKGCSMVEAFSIAVCPALQAH